MPKEISKNFQVLKKSIETRLKELDLEMESLNFKELFSKPQIVQLLYSNEEMFIDFIETFEDVLTMNDEAMKKMKRIAQILKGESQSKKLKTGAIQIKEIIFKLLLQEISEFGGDDEIKESFDQSEVKAIELLAKLNINSSNKENQNKFKKQIKKIKEEVKSKKIKMEIEEKTKKKKEKVLMQSKMVEDREFKESKMAEAEIYLGEELVIQRDCPPKLKLENWSEEEDNLERLRTETGLQILGNNTDLREVFANWEHKPMLRVLTNRSKQEIENNLKKIANQEGQQDPEIQENLKTFLEQETEKVEDTLDLFDKQDYFHELYMSGSRFYRDIERRYLFPYSDSLQRIKKSCMLSSLDIFKEEVRRNLLCYEREVLKNFELPEFYRVNRDEENSSNRVVLLYIFQISELSNNKNFEMTANFFALNKRCDPIQGTVNFMKIKDFFVFEGQYVGVCGDFEKGILVAKTVLPFDTQNVVNNEWNVSQVQELTEGNVKIRPGLQEEVQGKTEGREGWSRALKLTKASKTSEADRIVEEVKKLIF